MCMNNSFSVKALGALKIQTNHKNRETCFSPFNTESVDWDTKVGDTAASTGFPWKRLILFIVIG